MEINSIIPSAIVSYKYGSTVYGTNGDKSDEDIISIVPDNFEGMTEDEKHCIIDKYDVTLYKESYFIEKIKNYSIDALECIFLPSNMIDGDNKYLEYFQLDLPTLRSSISAICSNSYVKAKKKLIVEKDYDFYKAMKSLFHSIRIFEFGWQIAMFGRIINYQACNHVWDMISQETSTDWMYYHQKYKPIWNKYHSSFVEVANKEFKEKCLPWK